MNISVIEEYTPVIPNLDYKNEEQVRLISSYGTLWRKVIGTKLLCLVHKTKDEVIVYDREKGTVEKFKGSMSDIVEYFRDGVGEIESLSKLQLLKHRWGYAPCTWRSLRSLLMAESALCVV